MLYWLACGFQPDNAGITPFSQQNNVGWKEQYLYLVYNWFRAKNSDEMGLKQQCFEGERGKWQINSLKLIKINLS